MERYDILWLGALGLYHFEDSRRRGAFPTMASLAGTGTPEEMDELDIIVETDIEGYQAVTERMAQLLTSPFGTRPHHD